MTDVTTAPADEPEVDDDVEGRPAPFWQRLVAGSSTWIGLILLGLIVVFSLLDYELVRRASPTRATSPPTRRCCSCWRPG